MLKKTLVTLGSWVVGVLGVIGIFLYYQPQGFAATLESIGIAGVVAWILLTLIARICATEATVVPLATLGFHLTRPDAFWISWIRTFVNQITPLAGAAAYATMIRRHVGIPWSQIVALMQPQILLVAAAIGLVGLVATLVNFVELRNSVYPLGLLYAGLVIASLTVATGAHWLIESLPKSIAERAAGTSDALRTMAKHPNLIVKLLLYHTAAVVLRGSRIWFLFAAADVSLAWNEFVLVLAIAESALLVNLTPGNLGVREGAILGGAGLIHVPAGIAASVALIDRLFMIALTTLLAAPAFAILRKPQQP